MFYLICFFVMLVSVSTCALVLYQLDRSVIFLGFRRICPLSWMWRSLSWTLRMCLGSESQINMFSTARNVFWRRIWAELSCIQNIYKAISTGQVERVYLWWLSSIHWKGPDLHVDYSQFFSLHTHISPLPNPLHEVIVGICPVSCPTRLFRSG